MSKQQENTTIRQRQQETRTTVGRQVRIIKGRTDNETKWQNQGATKKAGKQKLDEKTNGEKTIRIKHKTHRHTTQQK